jgi:hypothetical protein
LPGREREALPEVGHRLLVVDVVVKGAPVEQVRDGHSDHVRDRVGRGGDDDDRTETRGAMVDQRLGDPAQALGRVVITVRRRVEAERVQITAALLTSSARPSRLAVRG